MSIKDISAPPPTTEVSKFVSATLNRLRRSSLRRIAFLSVSGTVLSLSATAHAQSAAPSSAAAAPVATVAAADPAGPTAGAPAANSQDALLQGVTVSASRLTTAGFSAPTPTQVLGAQELNALSEPNIAQAVSQLPALAGDPNPTSGNGATGTGNTGMSQLNLRALGTDRTLVLINGQRIAPSLLDGTVDVSLLPQLLIRRVDVVTGGASASYGSDAVAGVVNFITDEHFTGFKSNFQAGVTKYGDDRQGLAQLAWGTTALNNRFHVEASAEYYVNHGVPAPLPGGNGGPDGRTWGNHPRVATRSPSQTPAGQPQYFFYTPAQVNTYSAYGLITSGPLKGTAFGPGGTTYPFQYGSPCIGSICEGGDLSGNVSFTTASYDAPIKRGAGFTRLSYDILPNVELYASLWYAGTRTSQQPNAGAAQQGNLTIQCSNPFVPPSIQAACANDGITKFSYGVSNIIFPANIDVETSHRQARYVIGLNADDLNIFNKPWTFQAYGELGDTHVDINIHNMMLLPHYGAAINATALPNGQIACSSVIAQASGCVPLNVIGLNPVNPAAWAYIAPTHGPYENTFLKEEAGSVSLSGAPLDLWAGPLSVALGAEWRQESYTANSDPYGAGSAATSYSAAYPADPVLSTSGNNWYAGDFHNGNGIYNVREGFLELGLPLFDNRYLGKFDADVAGREADYSTSGRVLTWKLGGVWDTPLPGVRFRVVRSRDIRAPNLNDMFAPAVIFSNAGLVDRQTGQTVTALNEVVGNPLLKPEIAENFEAGIVLQPSWLSGFRASIDYYNIKITGGVESLTPQQEIDLCQISGNQDACKKVYFAPVQGPVDNNLIVTSPFNAGTIRTNGFDIAIGYQMDLRRLRLPGSFAFMGQASHVSKFEEDTGIPGQPLIEAAGANTNIFGGYTSGNNGYFGIAPSWKGLLTEGWNGERMGLSLIERFVSAGSINPTYIQCTPGACPLPTIQHPTIDYNRIPGAIYLDIAAHYDIGKHGQMYAKIDNTFDRDPPPYGSPVLYDWLGRTYRLGVRFDLQ